MTWLKRSAVLKVAIAVAIVSWLFIGSLIHHASSSPLHGRQLAALTYAAELEIAAELTDAPGNIAVTPDNRLIVSLHQFYEPQYRVLEILVDGTTRPFPNAAWSSAPTDQGIGMYAVLGLQADRNGIVWMVDNGGGEAIPRIIAWDTRSDRLHQIIEIPEPASRPGSFPNDLAVDLTHNAIYLADSTSEDGPALITVNLSSGEARRVLANHSLVQSEAVDMVIDDRIVTLGTGSNPEPVRLGVNPITIDPTDTWVYFGSMSGTAIYRVRTVDLINPALDDATLATRVERYGDKPISDGISIDTEGNVYVTDITSGAIGVTRPDGTYHSLATADWLAWPDGIAAGADGYLYVTVNQLHRSAPLNAGIETAEPPFHIARFMPLSEVVVGR